MKFNYISIGQIATVRGGKRLPKGKALVASRTSHPYIRIRDLTDKLLELTDNYEYVDDETQEKISRYIVNAGDIIISIVGTIGLIGVIGKSLDNANLTENCAKLVDIDGSIIDKEYLYYYLISPLGQAEIKKGTVGAVQPKLPLKSIQAIRIVLPTLKEQEKIGSLLKSLDEKITLNKKINENLTA